MSWELAGGTENLPTVLALQASGTKFDYNPIILKMGLALSAYKPSGVRWRQGDLWSFMGSLPSLLSEFQASKRL